MNLTIDLMELVPKKFKIQDVNRDYLRVYHKRKGSGPNAKPFIIPKLIEIDQELVEAIAMYIGDGKLSDDKHHLDFTSIDPDMVKFMFCFFTKRLNLNLDDIRYLITYKILSKDSIENWANYIGIPKDKINLKQSDRHRNECFGMQIGGMILRAIIGKLVNKVLEIDFKDNEILRRAFLRGLFAAEGSIAINNKVNYIVYIGFHLSYHKEEKLANLVKKLLHLEGIASKHIIREGKGERYIRIINWKNYYKLWKMDLFSLNQRKELLFLDKLKNTKFSCKLNSNVTEKLFVIKHYSQRQLAFSIQAHPALVCNILGNKRPFINIEHIIKLSKIASVPLDEIKDQMIEFRVNDITPINDREFIDFIFDLKASLILTKY